MRLAKFVRLISALCIFYVFYTQQSVLQDAKNFRKGTVAVNSILTSEAEMINSQYKKGMLERSEYIGKLKAFPTVPLWMQYDRIENIQYDLTQTNHSESKYLEVISNENLKPSMTNVTPADATLLMFSRVYKTGSTTFKTIVHELCNLYNFKFLGRGVSSRPWMSETERTSVMHSITTKEPVNTPRAYSGHFHYFNVTQLGYPRAVWISVVRHPVSRFISNYNYFRRRGRWSNGGMKNHRLPPSWWLDMDLNDCIEAQRPECFPTHRDFQLTFFCGHHQECRRPGSRIALHIAKKNVESDYSVVAILEELPLSVKIMERYLPVFFRNASSIPESSGEIKRNALKSTSVASNATKEALSQLLHKDVEFYDFLRQRLHLQAKYLGLN